MLPSPTICCRNSSSTEMLFFLLQLFFSPHSHNHNLHDSSSLAATIAITPPSVVAVVVGQVYYFTLTKKHSTQTTLRRKTTKKLCLLFNQALRLVVSFVCKTASIRRRPTRLVEVQVVGTDADDDELLLRPNCTKCFAERRRRAGNKLNETSSLTPARFTLKIPNRFSLKKKIPKIVFPTGPIPDSHLQSPQYPERRKKRDRGTTPNSLPTRTNVLCKLIEHTKESAALSCFVR
uniref:(northern house mosquito) hypothetical protein n=1 Tax=Culex pipiens TaxID=7175 RepID=A0A8D8A140_CULPI